MHFYAKYLELNVIRYLLWVLILQNYVNQQLTNFEYFNRARLDRARAAMHSQALNVFDLLPVLLHINHPAIPGFLNKHVVHGIANFTLSASQSAFIADCALVSGSTITEDFNQTNPAIKGLYAMGSTASLGQTFTSDLDIWICIQPWVSKAEQELLEQKCLLISAWAISRGIEINFFVMTEQHFRVVLTDEMTSEHCGTTQYYLLLDEFYRSAVHLAGLPLMWYLVPPEKEHDYDNFINDLVKTKALSREDWIDFGGLPSIPAEEYFGSSLWQLYKSIDSPFKSVLKAVLLEAYSFEYPNTEFLALQCKKNFFANKIDVYHTDSYLMMLNKVTKYLHQISDFDRLDLVRRCFYLKTHEKITRKPNLSEVEWRRDALATIVQEWGWSDAKIAKQDNHRSWKIKEVKKTHAELLKGLMCSYRNLIRFARRNKVTSSVSPEDLCILARKLYAAFEVLPEKVTLLNTQLSADLHEPDISFIQVPEKRNNPAGWYLYKRSLQAAEIIGQSPLEHNRYISKLVAWAYFNGLLTEMTDLHLIARNSSINIDVLYQFVSDMRNTFSLSRDQASRKALSKPSEIRKLALFVNIEQDPTSELISSGYHLQDDDMNTDVFSFGPLQTCLIGSLDLVYINSWNEVRTLHFKGERAMLDMLKTLLSKMHQDAVSPQSFDVFCYAEQKRGVIRSQIFKLVEECIQIRLNLNEQKKCSRFKILKIASQIFGIIFGRRGVSVQLLENTVDFYRTISKSKIGESELMVVGDTNIQPPEVVDAFASEGLIQFFFEDCSAGFNVYVLDENNRVEVYRQCSGHKGEMVQDLNSFYTSSQNVSANDEVVNFNLPQFYHIVQQNGRDQVIPYKSEPNAQRMLSTGVES